MTKVPENQGVSEGWQITLPPPVNNFGEQNCFFNFQPASDGLCRREKVRGRAAVFAGNARAPMIVRDFFPDKKSLQTMPLAERRRLGGLTASAIRDDDAHHTFSVALPCTLCRWENACFIPVRTTCAAGTTALPLHGFNLRRICRGS